MRLVDISGKFRESFFYCLHDVSEDTRRSAKAREKWYEKYRKNGYRARVLITDNDQVVGKCHYIPIEFSPLLGKDMMVILCITVYPYNDSKGDQRKKGYGRFMLHEIEKDVRSTGYRGIAVWAMDMDWNPSGFYRHMGYIESDREGSAVVLYKPFSQDLVPPRFLRPHFPEKAEKKRVEIFVIDNPWCDGLYKTHVARTAIQGLEDKIHYQEIKCSCHQRHLHLGSLGGVFINRRPYRPYQVIGDALELRNKIKASIQKREREI